MRDLVIAGSNVTGLFRLSQRKLSKESSSCSTGLSFISLLYYLDEFVGPLYDRNVGSAVGTSYSDMRNIRQALCSGQRIHKMFNRNCDSMKSASHL